MAEAFGAAAAALTVLEQVQKFIKKIRGLPDAHADLCTALEKHSFLIKDTTDVVKLIEEQQALKTGNIKNVLDHIEKTGEAMKKQLEEICDKLEQGGKIEQLARKAVFGPGEREKLENISNNLIQDKADLKTCLTLVAVGVIAQIGRDVKVNTEAVERVDRKLRETLGDDHGLKMRLLIQNREVDNGIATVPQESLSANLAMTVKPIPEPDKKPDDDPVHHVIKRRIVVNNVALKEAIMMNAPVGEDQWYDFDWIEIKNNLATEGAFMASYPMSEKVFLEALSARPVDKRLEIQKQELEVRKMEIELKMKELESKKTG